MGEIRLPLVAGNRGTEKSQTFLIKRLGPQLKLGRPGAHGVGIGTDFLAEIHGAFLVHAVLQTLIEKERVSQIEDGGFERRAFRGIDVGGAFPFFIDLGDVRPQFVVGAILLVRLWPAEHAEHLLVCHGENRIGVSFRRVEQDIRKPARGAQLLPLGQANRLLATQDEQRVAGHGVHRFDAAAGKHRNAVESREIELAGGGLGFHP